MCLVSLVSTLFETVSSRIHTRLYTFILATPQLYFLTWTSGCHIWTSVSPPTRKEKKRKKKERATGACDFATAPKTPKSALQGITLFFPDDFFFFLFLLFSSSFLAWTFCAFSFYPSIFVKRIGLHLTLSSICVPLRNSQRGDIYSQSKWFLSNAR